MYILPKNPLNKIFQQNDLKSKVNSIDEYTSTHYTWYKLPVQFIWLNYLLFIEWRWCFIIYFSNTNYANNRLLHPFRKINYQRGIYNFTLTFMHSTCHPIACRHWQFHNWNTILAGQDWQFLSWDTRRSIFPNKINLPLYSKFE